MKSYNKMYLNQEYICIKIIKCLGGIMIVHRGRKDRRLDVNTTNPIIGSLMKQLSVALVACLLALLLVMPSVNAEDIPQLNPPEINEIKSGDKKITGTGRFVDRSNKLPAGIIFVVIEDGNGNTKTIISNSSKTSPRWTVDLGEYEIKKGYTVTAYQEYNKKYTPKYSEEVYNRTRSNKSAPVTVQPSTSDNYDGKLTMPEIEVWIEEYTASILNADEEKEIVDAFKAANKDIEGVTGNKFGTENVTVKVTSLSAKDNSTTITVEFPDNSITTVKTENIKYKKITEPSRTPEIDTIYVADNVIKGKISGGGSFDKTKVQLILKVSDSSVPNFCDEKGCKVDKNSSHPIELNVNPDGTFSYILTGNDNIILGQRVGISVKDYRKLRTCRTTTVVMKTPDKVGVIDPKKLTAKDKADIDEAIRKANTTEAGISKLPDGTGYINGYPAIIEFAKDGNVRIISPNDVEVTWKNGQPIFQKNPDGSYKLQTGKEENVIKIPVKDLVKNLKPQSPKIAVDTDAGKVTITPPAYENPGEDTDLASYKVSYSGKTVTITRNVDGAGNSTWSASDGVTVDEHTGVVTLEIKDLAVGDTITAIAKDNGGLEGDTNPLESDPATRKLDTVEVVYDANGGAGNMEVQVLNKGVKHKLLDNAFTAPNGQEFDTWAIGGDKFAPGDEIKVDSDLEVKATWKALPNPPKNTDKVRIVAPQTGDVSILALCSPAILASVGMVALFRRRKEKR